MRPNTIKVVFLAAAIVAIGAAVTGMWIVRQRHQREAAVRETARLKAVRAAELDQLANLDRRAGQPANAPALADTIVPVTERPAAPPPTPPRRTNAPPPATSVANQPSPARNEIQDPLARAALSLVGADPDAEAYWMEAINNPDLSGHERQDLIEDLNEEGFPDPRNPTPGDLPLITRRLQLIENLAPDAMDQVNLDAFMEAYKDLSNMYVRLTRR